VKGLYQTFQAWFNTGRKGNGHEKPFYYWAILLLRYEWPICLGVLFSPVCLLLQNISIRYLTVTGVGTFVAYSIVNYKTPWCIISIVWPLLFAFGALLLIVPRARLAAMSVLAVILVAISLLSSIVLNYFRCSTFTDFHWKSEHGLASNLAGFFTSEPYVYVQTYNDIYKLTTPLLDLAHRDPVYYHLTGHLIRTSPYPLPWILGDFPRVGYYEHENDPPDMDADFLLVQEDRVADVESKLHDSYYTEPLTIRPYQDTSKLYLRARVFKSYFGNQPPSFVGKQ
jgi:hypothetical protein